LADHCLCGLADGGGEYTLLVRFVVAHDEVVFGQVALEVHTSPRLLHFLGLALGQHIVCGLPVLVVRAEVHLLSHRF